MRVFKGDAFDKLSTNAEIGDANGAAAYFGTPEADQAVVVVPPGESKTNAEIAKSFSDEVLITQDNNEKSGIIKPVFRDETTDAYRFLMVPLRAP